MRADLSGVRLDSRGGLPDGWATGHANTASGRALAAAGTAFVEAAITAASSPGLNGAGPKRYGLNRASSAFSRRVFAAMRPATTLSWIIETVLRWPPA